MLRSSVKVGGGDGKGGSNIIGIARDRVVVVVIVIHIHPKVVENTFTTSMTITTKVIRVIIIGDYDDPGSEGLAAADLLVRASLYGDAPPLAILASGALVGVERGVRASALRTVPDLVPPITESPSS